MSERGEGGRAYIAAADADVGDADQNLTRVCEGGDGFVLEFSVVRAVEDDGGVLHCAWCGQEAEYQEAEYQR